MRTRDYDKQRRIKESMVRLILRDGLGGASVAKIARDAGVSPATIYVYYDSKETMLAEVYRECSHESYNYLQGMIRPGMSGSELIETIVRGFYTYTMEHEEVFSFVEQCTRCPSVTEEVSLQECCCGIFDLIHEYQRRGIGAKLLEKCIADVKAQGMAGIHLITAGDGILPAFYEKYGFTKENEVILIGLEL